MKATVFFIDGEELKDCEIIMEPNENNNTANMLHVRMADGDEWHMNVNCPEFLGYRIRASEINTH